MTIPAATRSRAQVLLLALKPAHRFFGVWALRVACNTSTMSRSKRSRSKSARPLFWFEDHFLHLPRQYILAHVPLSLDVSSVASANRLRHRICYEVTTLPRLHKAGKLMRKLLVLDDNRPGALPQCSHQLPSARDSHRQRRRRLRRPGLDIIALKHPTA